MSDSDIQASEAAGRYASALYELALEAKSLKTVEKDLNKLKALFDKHADLRTMAANPVFALEDKAAAIEAVCKKAKLSKLVVQFAGTAAKNRRAQEIPSMIAAFNAKVAKARGTSIAKVTSAKKLTAAQLTSIKAQLKKTLGQDIAVETAIDLDLLGGFVIQVGSRLFDSSLKTKLEGLKMAMKEV